MVQQGAKRGDGAEMCGLEEAPFGLLDPRKVREEVYEFRLCL